MLLDAMAWLLADLYNFGNAIVLEGLAFWQAVKVLSLEEFWESQDKQTNILKQYVLLIF